MNSNLRVFRAILLAILGNLLLWAESSSAQSAGTGLSTNQIRIVKLQNVVEVLPAGAVDWVITQTNQILRPNWRVRTGPDSRVSLVWSDSSVVSFGPSTEIEILPPHPSDSQYGVNLWRGVMSFFHRDRPGRIRIITRGAVAGVEGTEFVLAVEPVNGTERTVLSVIDGRVSLANEQGSVVLGAQEQAVAEPGRAPARTAGFVVNNVLQWSFYYPAVLDVAELPLSNDEHAALRESLDAYRNGDVLAALQKYPAGREPGSDADRIYRAAILLGVGEVEKAVGTLDAVTAGDALSRTQRLAAALRELIAAVKDQSGPSTASPELATEFLARSYHEQSRALGEESLKSALSLARRAADKSPQFGFAWARVAELEFSFGRTEAAERALDKALVLSPRNAQAIALNGFLLAARNRPGLAIDEFNRAIAVDAALGNAWLGRGLNRIRRGDLQGGREDLLVAAAIEPQRSDLRSYLGKAYGNSGDYGRAITELDLARNLDQHDPTPWLYSALLKQENNRINDAIRDLEKSAELNDNRSLYRSRLLLESDQAVRSANLAAMYRDAGMPDVAVREAARAVNYDYANYSAHLFLANSYSLLRDPNLINLRYETAALNEYLLATLLSPVSAGTLSPAVSQSEYSPLFERDRFGVVSVTEYLSRGAWTQAGAQFGVVDRFGYSLEAVYRTDPGQRVNNRFEARQLSLAMKYELTPDDTIYLQVKHLETEMGDLLQYYDPATANSSARIREKQEPIVALGYHHEWNPGVHTLLFMSRLDDEFEVTNSTTPSLLVFRPGTDFDETTLTGVQPFTGRQGLRGDLEIYSAELQQIWQQPKHSTILGGRFQYGEFRTRNLQVESSLGPVFPLPPEPIADQEEDSRFRRWSVYGYHHWDVLESVQLIGGVTYDHLTFPENFQSAPISDGESTIDKVSPKAGLIWRPADRSAVRFAYTRSVGGASLDQSYRLEPSQVAGFIQSYRSIIPESVVGPQSGAEFETFGLSIEQRLPKGTYLGLSGEWLNSEFTRQRGAFDYFLDFIEFPVPSTLPEELDYEEQSVLFTLNQLVGESFSFGARYRVSRARLDQDLVGVPSAPIALFPTAHTRSEAILHEVGLSAVFNHRCGFFAHGEALWYGQNIITGPAGQPEDQFWYFNAFAGYRFPRRKAEVSVGLLNIGDQDYRLNPLNIYNELPRDRTFVVRLQLRF